MEIAANLRAAPETIDSQSNDAQQKRLEVEAKQRASLCITGEGESAALATNAAVFTYTVRKSGSTSATEVHKEKEVGLS